MSWLVKRAVVGAVVAMQAVGCTSPQGDSISDPTSPASVSSTGTRSASSSGSTQPPADQPTTHPRHNPERPAFDPAAAGRTIRFLAGGIGPREANSAQYRHAARWVQQRFEHLGYSVRLQELSVPAGTSWGVPVPAGRTWNVIATRGDYSAFRRHLIVGAHLDTVPQAPGAEDNASGIAVLLELARLTALRGARLPVMFVAFAGEEPRGVGDDLHHFGSTALVERMTPAQRRAVVGMVAMDRVGVGNSVPVCTGGVGLPSVQRQLLSAARRTGVPAHACLNTASDHWSFEKAGVAAARLGGTPYAAYHSVRDLPRVVDARQLARTGRLMERWLTR